MCMSVCMSILTQPLQHYQNATQSQFKKVLLV